MKTMIFMVVFLLLWCITSAQTDPVDQAALISFWNGLTSKGDLLWNTTTSLCGQPGVQCAAQKVSRLKLDTNQLAGAIPTEIGKLTSMTWLQLYNNQLSGTMPTEMGMLTSLYVLELHSNQLTGTIPVELGMFTSMCCLHLENNQLSGTIPSQLHSHQFSYLFLANNLFLCYWVDYSFWAVSSDYSQVGNCQNCLNPCQNNGECKSGLLTYSCSCLSDFQGVVCEKDIKMCRSSPCQNGGTCYDIVDKTLFCDCPPGFSGKYCQFSLIDCSSSPCKNNGNCSDEADSFTCDCSQTGYIGNTCDILLLAVVALPVVLFFTIAFFFLLRRRYPAANNSVVLSVTLTLYDFVTDCAFMFSQSQKDSTLFVASLTFIIVPVLFNLFSVAKIFVTSVLHHPEMEMWLKKNMTAASAVAILASTNIEMFALLHSRLFNAHSFNAPIDARALKTIAIAGLVGSFLEDVPQLIIQSIAAFSHGLDTITFLSIVASILTIFFGLFKNALLFLVTRFGASSYPKRVENVTNESEGNLITAYTNFGS